MDAIDFLDSNDPQPTDQPGIVFRTIGQLVDLGLESIKGLSRKAGVARTVVRRQLKDQGGVTLSCAVRLSDACEDLVFEVDGRIYRVDLVDAKGQGEEAVNEPISDEYVTARVPHACTGCHQDIPVGEEYRKRVYRLEGQFHTEKSCPSCLDGRYSGDDGGTSVAEGLSLPDRF